MKSLIKIILFSLIPFVVAAQRDSTWGYVSKLQADSLRTIIKTEPNDTFKMAVFRSLGFYYQESKPDSARYFHEQQLLLAQKLKLKMWQADAYSQAGYVLNLLGDNMRSYDFFTEARKLAGDEKNESSNWREWTFSNAENFRDARIAILGMNYQMMGNVWGSLGEPEKQKASYWQGVKLGDSINNGKLAFCSYASLARFYSADSSIMYYKKGLEKAASSHYKLIGYAYLGMAQVYYAKGMWDSVIFYANKTKEVSLATNDLRTLSNYYQGTAGMYYQQGNKDSSLLYAKKALETAKLTGTSAELLAGYIYNALAYALNTKTDSTSKYWQLAYLLNDSLRTVQINNLTKYQKQSFNEQLRLKKKEEEKKAYENKMKMVGLLALIAGILLVAVILYRNNRQKQKTNQVLEETLVNLKSTQTQLIQSEKMASLGELTAGIAHEIQNPLNFVNNFSEVSMELLDEMKTELDNNNTDEAKQLANDVMQNLEKILHHGRRADAIVKGMLQHSRSSSSQKELTNINALADEYLRLAYHGLRAKDKSFNATLKTSYDETIGNINIIPQDIGRVILNLITNAFYVVNEKKNQGLESYEPIVTVKTLKNPPSGGRGAEILISVKDNGPGIPQTILDKIFQPFFTTKPTGQGTGLGLSLSYDIVTKGHGGQLEVKTKEGLETEFIMYLPLQ